MATTRNLFGEVQTKYLNLYLPVSNKALQAASDLLGRLFSKNDLVEIYGTFRKWTADYEFKILDNKGELASQTIATSLKAKQNQRFKEHYCDFLGMMISDERNLETYFKFMPEKSREVFRQVILRGCLTIKEARKIGSIPKKQRSSYYYGSESLEGEFSWLTTTNFGYYYYYDSENSKYVYLQSSLCRYFMAALLPEFYAQVKNMPELPGGVQWQVSSFEKAIFADAPLIEGMFSQGVISVGKTKLLMATVEKKVDQLGIQDFPVVRGDGNTRARMLTTYIAMMKSSGYNDFDGVSRDVDDQTFFMLRNFPLDDGGWFQICTPFINGARKASVTQASNAAKILKYVDNFLFTFNDKGWLSVEDIIMHAYANLISGGNYIFAFDPDRYNMSALPENAFAGNRETSPDKIVELFTKPLIRGFLYLLASWGLIETAEDGKAVCKASPFDALRYVRVSQLGRYALGVVKEYQQPEGEKKVWFELDDDRLIFRSLYDNNPYTVILNDVSNAIGGGRYEVTAESFLSHCSTRADVEQKIDIFKQYIGRELPQMWKDFFDEMLRHCQPLEKLPITNYKMYRVAKDNKTLQRLLTTDEKLRALVIRAEGYRIIIRKDDISKFENRLKSFGYLL